MPDRYDHDWGPFPETVLYFEGAEMTPVDLQRPVSGETMRLLLDLQLTDPFGVVTAYNPLGVARPEVINAARATHLQVTLARHGVRYIGVEGRSTDGMHREPGVAVMLPRDEVVELARAYGQLGIFWFDGTKFWIVPAKSDAAAVALPLTPTLTLL